MNDYTANGKDTGKLSGRIIDSDMHDVGRFLNRLLGLPPDIQNRYHTSNGFSRIAILEAVSIRFDALFSCAMQAV